MVKNIQSNLIGCHLHFGKRVSVQRYLLSGFGWYTDLLILVANSNVVGHVVLPRCVLPLTEENVEKVLDEVRPGLMADGGNVALHEIDGLVVVLKLQGACGSCPSSTRTLKMGIETRLRDKIPEIMDVEQIMDTETGLELTEENIEKVK